MSRAAVTGAAVGPGLSALTRALPWARRGITPLWQRGAGQLCRGPQLWRRGARLPIPESDSRTVTGEHDWRFLDRALRDLATAQTGAGRVVPQIYGARLNPDGLDLLLADHPRTTPPESWIATPDGTVWRLPHHPTQPDGPSGLAPYPGLVLMGTAGRDCVFVDVEAAPGVIAVGGDPAQRLSVIAAMAAGLVTSAWSGRIRITLVGFGVGLTVFAPGRVRHSESLEELLPELDVESAERARLLAASGAGSVLTGRLSAEQATSWTPHVVLVGEQPSARMRARLAALGVAGSRVGISYLVAGEVPGAAWRFEAGPDGVLRAPLLDIEVAAHRLPVAGEVATGGRPVDHELWCHLLRAAHVARDVARLQSAVGELYRRTIVHRGVHGLHPATRALVDELPMR